MDSAVCPGVSSASSFTWPNETVSPVPSGVKRYSGLASLDFFFAVDEVDLAAPALFAGDLVVAAVPLAAPCADADFFAFTDVVAGWGTAFFAGDALVVPAPAAPFFAMGLLTTFLLATGLRAALFAAGVLLGDDAVVLLAAFLPADLVVALPAAVVAVLLAVVLPAALPLVVFLPATFVLAAFLVAMLDSRSMWPLRQRRQSR
jgi:hypothetical protein